MKYIHAIVPLNVKATSLNCSTRLLNQPQSTSVKHCEIIATHFLSFTPTQDSGARLVIFYRLIFLHVVYFHQQAHACACICMVENDQKHSKIMKKVHILLMFYYCVECRTHTKTPALFSK